MEYKHKILGNFQVNLKGLHYLSLSVTNYVEQMVKNLADIDNAIVIEFRKDIFIDNRQHTHKNLLADVTLAPGVTLVTFQTLEGLPKHAIDQLQELLEAELIQYARANLKALRAEFRLAYLQYARSKFMDLHEATGKGIQFVDKQLPNQPTKFAGLLHKPFREHAELARTT